MPIALAVNELWREAGGQFDRALVPLFVMELERRRDVISPSCRRRRCCPPAWTGRGSRAMPGVTPDPAAAEAVLSAS